MEHHRAGRLAEADKIYRQVLVREPSHPDALHLLGVIHAQRGQPETAVDLISRALKVRPDVADAHSNLGAALTATGALDEAIASLQIALQLNPNLPGAHNNLGKALFNQGRISEAIEAFSKAASLNPDDPKSHANLALAYLLLGDFPRGWREHEWRLKIPAIVGGRQFSVPQWDGRNLDGQTILLHPEQGFGDIIQFARFVPEVAARGGRVILECPPELFRLFRGFPYVAQLVQSGGPLPHFDVQCPLLSLAGVLNITAETIPCRVPYLRPDRELVQRWGERFDAGDQRLRVGLAWAGRPNQVNNRNRSMGLPQFAPLASVESIAFFSLQKGDAAAQAAQPPTGLRFVDWTADLADFADTAAMIENLDLVLTVDTAVAHVAGAMGKRVWVLLPWIPDWRWMLERTDSPWYPSMRLFRQAKMGDWADVLQRVAASLQNEKRS